MKYAVAQPRTTKTNQPRQTEIRAYRVSDVTVWPGNPNIVRGIKYDRIIDPISGETENFGECDYISNPNDFYSSWNGRAFMVIFDSLQEAITWKVQAVQELSKFITQTAKEVFEKAEKNTNKLTKQNEKLKTKYPEYFL